MLIVVLTKGVPARTTQTIQVGGVLNREAMELVLNPHDSKAVEAADFLKRRVGGKVVALSMGPDMKLAPIMKPLYSAEALGVDEEYILSDRKMAGSDTLATSYALSLGVRKLLEKHVEPLDLLSGVIRRSGYSEAVRAKARELYEANLVPNSVYSALPSERESIVERFLAGKITSGTAVSELESEKERVSRFIVLSGIKTTDGETGSVGPQVAEGVSELLGRVLPHATYVEEFDLDQAGTVLVAKRMIGYLAQTLEMELPALITVSTGYRPGEAPAANLEGARRSNYRGKVRDVFRWTADDLRADPKRLGLAGSPTIVGTGVDLGKPPVQKKVGSTLVFKDDVTAADFEGKTFGPYAKGDVVPPLPQALVDKMSKGGQVGVFDFGLLAQELLA